MSGASPVFLEMGKPDQGAEETCSRCYSEAKASTGSPVTRSGPFHLAFGLSDGAGSLTGREVEWCMALPSH